MPQLDLRQGGSDVLAPPGLTFTLRLTGWEGGSLDGRSFAASVDGVDDAVSAVVAGDTIVVVFDGTVTAGMGEGRFRWRLHETTSSDLPMIVGRLLLTDSATDSQLSTIRVVVEDVAVAMTVLGAPGPPGADGVDGAAGADGVAAATGLATYDAGTRTVDVAAAVVAEALGDTFASFDAYLAALDLIATLTDRVTALESAFGSVYSGPPYPGTSIFPSATTYPLGV